MKRGFLKTLLFSNFLILMFAIFIAFFAVSSYQANMKRQIEDYNRIYLSQIKNTFDERLVTAGDIINSISMDMSVQSLVFQKKIPDKYERYTALEVRNKLSSYVSSHTSIDSIIVYYNYSDLTITNSTVYRSQEEFFELSSCAYWRPEDYGRMLEDVGYLKYVSSGPAVEKNIYTVIKPIPLGSMRENTGYVIVNFYYTFLQDMVEDLGSAGKGSVLVIDNRDNMILQTGDLLLDERSARRIRQSPANAIEYLKIGTERYLVCQLLSGSTRFRYFFLLPESSFSRPGVNVLLVLVSVLTIFLGIIFCIISAKRNANPIERIAALIRQRGLVPADAGSCESEIEFINRSTLRALNEYTALKNEYARQIPILQSNMISTLLRGGFTSEADIRAGLRSIGMEMEYGRYAVILFQFQAGSTGTVLEYSWLNVTLKNILFDLFSSDGSLYLCDLDIGRIGAILNTDSMLERENLISLIEGLIRSLREQHGVLVTAVIDGDCGDLKQVPELYRHCAQMIDYQLFHHPGRCAFYSETGRYSYSYLYSSEMQGLLTAGIKSGNLSQALHTLDKICEDNLKYSLPIEVMKSLFIDLVGTLTSAVSAMGMDVGFLYAKSGGESPVEDLIRCENFSEMKQRLYELYTAVITVVSERRRSQSRPLIESILAYIDENYADQALSLNLVAAAFSLNASYLSTYFKRYYGDTFINYVNTVRLRHARELLENTDAHISEIAARVGYGNSGIFINNFKKAFHMTPGSYRGRPGPPEEGN